jgi:hypothetical protein
VLSSQCSFEIIIATLQLQRCTIAAALAVVMRGSAAISRSARAVEMQRDAVEQNNMKYATNRGPFFTLLI